MARTIRDNAIQTDRLVSRRMTDFDGVAVSTANHRVKVKMIAERKAKLSMEEWGTSIEPLEMNAIEAALVQVGAA